MSPLRLCLISICLRSLLSISVNEDRQTTNRLYTVVDRRIFPPYKFRQVDNTAATMKDINKVDIEFYLKLSNLGNHPILIIESNNTRMSLIINECLDFSIIHENHNIGKRRTKERLLSANIRFLGQHTAKPLLGNAHGYTRFHIQIIDQHSVYAQINGVAIHSTIEHELFPINEPFNIRIDGPEFPMGGSIKCLYIRASTKQRPVSAQSKVDAGNSWGRWLYTLKQMNKCTFKQMDKL